MVLQLLCWLLLLIPILVDGSDDVPIFEWFKYNHDNAELKITFPDGQDSDFALLSKTKNFINTVDNNDCLFSGNLAHEPDIPVSLTHICDDKDNFEISVNSRKLTHYMFKVTNSKVETLTSSLIAKDTPTFVPPQAQALGDGMPPKQLPKEGFLLRLKLFYDQSFRETFGSRVESVLNRVVSHAQTIFYWPSLMTKVKLMVVQIEGIDIRYVSSENNLYYLGDTYSTRSSSSINANVYFCVDSDKSSGQGGIAHFDAVCNWQLKLRSTIVEHGGSSDAKSAETLAHELGHMLGMRHDFIDKNNQPYQRYDSLHRKCKDIESIMDYHYIRKQWSTCSVEDFTNYYSNHEAFCLPLLSDYDNSIIINWGERINSPKNLFYLILQKDNNLVIYRTRDTKAIWATSTVNSGATRAIFQTDGNLVLYNDNNNAIWNSGTHGNPGSSLSMQDDGNLVIYSSLGHPIWASHSVTYDNSIILNLGERINSPKNLFYLTLQKDNNLVIYRTRDTKAIWATSTVNSGVTRAIFQTDGNLVLYNDTNNPIWNSGTHGNLGSTLSMQDDGNLVIYSSLGHPIWASHSVKYDNSIIINWGERVNSPKKLFHLTLQIDNNLVIYRSRDNKAVWATATVNTGATRAIFQTDGNFVLYNDNNKAIWNSGTNGNPGSSLSMQDDGNLVIYSSKGHPIWATHSVTSI